MRINYKGMFRDKSRQLIVEEGKSKSAQLECDLKQRKINELMDQRLQERRRHRDQVMSLLDLLAAEKHNAANSLEAWRNQLSANDVGGLLGMVNLSAQDASRK